MRRVLIMDAGEHQLHPGEQVERSDYSNENDRMGGCPKVACYTRNVLIGYYESFTLNGTRLFQRPIPRDTPSINGKPPLWANVMMLRGLKETSFCRLIPAGTGMAYS